MTKAEFSERLRNALCGLSDKDILSSLDYYAEMIADRMEAGMTEEAAVAALGEPEEIAREILLDQPLPTVVKTAVQKSARRRKPWRTWELVLLAVGSPLWLPLALTAAVLLLTVYALLWTVVVCFWAADLALGSMALAGIAVGVANLVEGTAPTGILYLGVALVSAGLGVVGFLGCMRLTVVFARLSAKFARWVKSLFIRKERADVGA